MTGRGLRQDEESPAAACPLSITTFHGGQRTILAIHGVTAYGLRFVRLAGYLSDWRWICPDLRGHGSSPQQGPWTVDQHVADLLPLVRDARHPLVLVGSSFGGLIAWELASKARGRVAALVLVDPVIGIPQEVAAARRAELLSMPTWADRAEALAFLLARRQAGGQWAAFLDVAVDLLASPDGRLERRRSRAASLQAWHEMERPLNASGGDRYDGPTLLVEAGREMGSNVTPSLVAAFEARLGEHLTHRVLDSVHNIVNEEPETLATAIREYLDDPTIAAAVRGTSHA